MRKFTKRTATVAVAAVALSGVGVAYAYWTTTGSGTGSATSGTDAGADKISLLQVGSTTGMYPGGPGVPVVVRAVNPAAFDQKVGEVTVTITNPGTCGEFVIDDVADDFGILQENDGQAGGADESAAAGQTVATLKITESGANQDDCKNVVPALAFASANGE